MEIAALITGSCFLFHLLVLFFQWMKQDNNYNQNISIQEGRMVGKDAPESSRLLNSVSDESKTRMVVRPKQQVTSSFSSIGIRLLQQENGCCLDYDLDDQVIIGRKVYGNTAEIQIEDSMVSQQHCRIYRRGEQIFIQDLGSTNHTYLNGCLVEGVLSLMPGDLLQIGKNSYRFQCFR